MAGPKIEVPMSPTCRVLVIVAAGIFSLGACARGSSTPSPGASTTAAEPAPQPPTGKVNPDAETMVAFQERVKTYLALQAKAKSGLPALPTDATPEQIHAHQLALAARIRAERTGAAPGEVFEPGIQNVVRGLMARVFGGPEGTQLKADIMDENPGRIRIAVNDRYPDNVPLSTVPPQVLKELPNLPKEIEYRFLGRALILFDSEAHLIVDYMDNAIP
jgi:hypothetical protein